MPDFPTVLSNVADNTNDVMAKHINNLEAKVGINGSANTDSLDYKVAAIMSALNPIGTIREFAVSTNPATLLGFGTWVAFGTGRTTVGIDAGDADFDTVEETRGAKTHQLTTAELAKHKHTVIINYKVTRVPWVNYGDASDGSGTNYNEDTSEIGSDTAHNNIQPSIVVYRWKRTA